MSDKQSPMDTEKVDFLVHRLRSLAEAYPESMFPPLTDKEHTWITGGHPGLLDRISASMARHFSPLFIEAADGIEQLRNEISECRQECEEQARVNGMGASREAALLAKLEEAKRIADTFVCDLLRNESSDGPWREIGMDHEGLLPQLVYAEGRHLIQRHPDRADTFRFTARGVETL